MKTLIFIIFIIATSFSLLLFHDKGNELISPYLSSYLSKETKRNIEIKELKIDMGHIEATAVVDKINQLKTDGEFSLSTQKVDLNYQLRSKNFPLKKLDMQGDIDVNGTAKGSIEKIEIKGSGDAFAFDLAYNFILNNQEIHKLHIDMDKADVERVLKIAKQPPLAQGKADIRIDIPTIVGKKISSAKMDIKLYKTLLNEKVLHQSFNINIPSHTTLTADINSTLEKEIAHIKGDIHSTLGSLSFNDAQYSLKDKKLHSDYQVNIKEPKSNFPLDAKGEVEYHEKLKVKGVTKSLDGEIHFNLIDTILQANLNGVSVTKLMTMLNYPKMFEGQIFGDITYNIKNKQGDINTQLKQAQLLPNKITEFFKMIRGVDLAKERYNHSLFKAKIHGEDIDFNFNAKSKTTNISLKNSHLNQKTKDIDAYYTLIIYNREISGTIKGNIHDPNINIDASKFIKKEIKNTIKKFGIGEEEKKIFNDTMQDMGIGKEEKDMIKGIFKGFF